jgi:N-acetylglucosamine-6-sulfatase
MKNGDARLLPFPRSKRTRFGRAVSVPLFLALTVWAGGGGTLIPSAGDLQQPPRSPAARSLNVVFVLVDDLRFDALGLMGHPWLETPNLDALARGGVQMRNAFVTTALCSPSRASILTGQYAHRHRVVDNNNPVPPGTTFFPQLLQKAGYDTAFIGKWHMGGDSDAPQPGFDRWVSFRGQGTYLPSKNGLNVDGKSVPQRGYITDELTDYALEWLKGRTGRPFFLYLSHKAVHAEFIPAERHKGRYAGKPFVPPRTMADTAENYEGKPMWVRNQRNSWHGVDFPYHGDLNIAEYYRRYAETLLAVDESVGRIVQFLRDRKLLDSTIVMFMGDNGFAFGEHGLIDKRTAYEASMRVPLLMMGGGLPAGRSIEDVVANIDIAPTVLDAAGVALPAARQGAERGVGAPASDELRGVQGPPRSIMDGRSFLPLVRGERIAWRDTLLYEYYWERNFPQTPAMHALRGAQYKYIRYYGIWDTDELYDLRADPLETRNLIRDPAHRDTMTRLNAALFDTLSATGGLYIPLAPDRGGSQNLRRRAGSKAADFPPYFFAEAPRERGEAPAAGARREVAERQRAGVGPRERGEAPAAGARREVAERQRAGVGPRER